MPKRRRKSKKIKEIEKGKKFKADSFCRRCGVLNQNHTVISSRLLHQEFSRNSQGSCK